MSSHMNSLVRNRQRNDPQSSPIDSDDDTNWNSFTSALPSLSSTPKRRTRAGSSVKGAPVVDWTSAWKEEGEQGVKEHSAGVSRSSSGSRRHPPSSNLTYSPSHPLVSPSTSPAEEGSHDDDYFPKRQLRPRGRAGSDGNYGENKRLIYGNGKDSVKPNDEEREVIIHKVQPTDSLAGVALRYGIELAELRKANKLWASDPIHLRDVLYIPIDSQKWSMKLSAALDRLNLSEEDEQVQTQSDTGRPSHTKSLSVGSKSRSKSVSASTVHRIPASQLSFFPPPSSSSHPAKDPDDPLLPGTIARHARPQLPSSLSTSTFDFFSLPLASQSSSSRNIPSIFNVFSNIPSSSRVSLSSDATPSEISDEIDVELDSVDRWRTSRPRDHTKGKGKAVIPAHDPRPRSAGNANQVKATTTSFAVYTPPPKTSQSVRTIRTQPTPSPQMELPTRAKPPW
ncbi:hypothetical protein FRC03_011419 [Tulasnella sp. 419]|nr:hypothetical protein FRC02_009132 [Tulasnella sp. 418]KAG8954571.1 hypothetical protein FRC03_011419 [Tulasnella sp. 419]